MTLEELEQHLLQVAAQTPRVSPDEPPSAVRRRSKELLRDSGSAATACFRAAEALCGPGFRSWEPESVWLTLQRQDVDLPLVNRDKILAAVTLTIIPAFWWEVNAFENTTMAFNNIISDGRVVQEATPAQLCWSVYEAELLYQRYSDFEESPEFDREPKGYTAIVLNRTGFIVAPALLQFAQDDLDRLNKNGGTVTKDEVQSAWGRLKRRDLSKLDFGDSALDAQLSRLAATQLYVQRRAFQYEEDQEVFDDAA